MFNKYINNHTSITHNSPSRIDVHEHRAPTDESVKLFNEIEDKVLNNILFHKTFNENNSLTYTIDIIELAPQTTKFQDLINTKLLVFSAIINGKEYVIKKRLGELGINHKDELIHQMKTGERYPEDEIFKIRLIALSNLIAEALINTPNREDLCKLLIRS